MSKLYLASARASSRLSLQANMAAVPCGRDAAKPTWPSMCMHAFRHGELCGQAYQTNKSRKRVQQYFTHKRLLGVLERRKLVCKKRQVLACCRCSQGLVTQIIGATI